MAVSGRVSEPKWLFGYSLHDAKKRIARTKRCTTKRRSIGGVAETQSEERQSAIIVASRRLFISPGRRTLPLRQPASQSARSTGGADAQAVNHGRLNSAGVHVDS